MSRNRMSRLIVILTIVCLVGVASAAFAGPPKGKATPRKMSGSWSSIVTIPPNDVLGNPVDFEQRELDTFSAEGGVITTSEGWVLPLSLGGDVLFTSIGTGHGNWTIIGGDTLVSTQWRLLTNVDLGLAYGYAKILVEGRFQTKDYISGDFQVHLMELNMETPFYANGDPIVIEGPFDMWRLPIERMP